MTFGRFTQHLGRAAARLAIAASLLPHLGPGARAATSLPPSDRTTIALGQTPWLYLFGDPAGAQAPGFADAAWTTVGIPYSADQLDTFLNTQSGGGDGYLNGPVSWYRHHFTLAPAQAGHKVLVEFEGAHVGVQVFINGTLLPGMSAVPADAQATHVVGFVPFIVDLTPYVKFDGSDQVLAVRAAKNASFFEDPGFSEDFRFGQEDSGLFRPVDMFITNKVHIPENVYSNLGTWGTYVSTLSASPASALIDVQTNVLNETTASAPVTLTTEIIDAAGNVVATGQSSRTIAPNGAGALQPTLFDQRLTVANPTLWYPNDSLYGKPYMYMVFHIVSVNGAVVDAAQSPLGIRTITWDKNFPYINGKPQYLWGASGRYDYPALGASVPEEQKWRDLRDLAAAGGNLWRPGHSTESEEFVDAADAYGIMIVEPSGEGEGAFASHCGNPPCDMQTLKSELHRDMIIRDRNHPSILAWEADNGPIDTGFAQSLKAISKLWDPINTRVQADRTPNPANGDILSCTLEGCEVLVKQQYPASPAWGAEYWGTGSARGAWDSELAFVAPFLDNWRQSRQAGAFGIAQWYFADSPGESGAYAEGVPGTLVRSLGASMTDMNRFPKLLYYAYEAAWTPFSIKPVVHLAHHWNRSGAIQVNAFSNCPSVRLLINGVAQGPDQTPNPWTSNAQANLTQSTTLLPFQVHWNVTWQPGTVTAACLDAYGNTLATDSRTTAGAPDHVLLSVVPSLVRPDGTSFATTADGSDATFVTASIVDANGVVVPTATNPITFAVSGPATYVGGSEQYVTANQPLGFHAPGDHTLAAEAGMTKIALRAQFEPGTVTVTATSPGLGAGSATYAVAAVGAATTPAGPPSIIVPPAAEAVTAGQSAAFSVTADGAAPLRFQWLADGAPIAGATSSSFSTGPASLALDGESYAVAVTDAAGRSTTSPAATLSVYAAAAPVLTVPPQGQSAVAGATATFSVVATGSPTLSYQWSADGAAIAGATGASYTTATLGAAEDGTRIAVTVSNPVGSVTSPAALLTVGAAIAPAIAVQPASIAAPPNQPATLSVTATGSAPLGYQWFDNGVAIAGAAGPTLTIAPVSQASAGSYTVTVANAAGSVTSAAAVLSIAPPGSNLALHARAWASSTQDPVALAASNAVDGDLTTRWASAQGIDPSWLAIDLGTAQPVDQIVLYWEAAYATSYQIQTSNDAATWTTAVANTAGHGGIETLSFPTVTARYVRVYGLQRATGYGYSLYEVKLYDVAACGGAAERFTVLDPADVRDNLTGLTWRRSAYTLAGAGAQFTQGLAQNYCRSLDMRLPTLAEATGIGAAADASCAFPQPWSSWTSTPSATSSAYAWLANSAGQSSLAVADNYPGAALCDAGTGTTLTAPVITTGPASQTVAAGAVATFSVVASGTAPLAYQWSESGVAIPGATDATYSTVGTAADNGAAFTVAVTGPTGLATTSAAATLTVSASASPPPVTGPPPGGNPPAPVATPADDLLAIAAGTTAPVAGFGADTDETGGGTASWPGRPVATAGVSDAAPAAIYQSERSGSFDYVLPGLSPGRTYALRLHFAELYFSAIGQRVFDVAVNGAPVLANFDIVAAAGGPARALAVNLSATADAAGRITIAFAPGGADQPKVSGIELLSPGAGTVPVITTEPASAVVAYGQQPVFSAVAAGPGTLSYQWYRNGIAVAGATGATYTAPAAQASDSGSTFQLVVGNGTETTRSVIVTLRTVSAPALRAIAAGSPAAIGSFAADTDYTGGVGISWTNAVSTAGVADAAPEAVYQDARQGPGVVYAIRGLAAGTTYPVRLHFAENYWSSPGQRVFDVALNGTVVLPGFDIVAASGGKDIAYVAHETATADATGTITVALAPGAHGADQPSISGIEVVQPAGTASSPTPAPSPTPTPLPTPSPAPTPTPTPAPAPAAPLAFATRPAATTVTIGRSAGFSVAATGGTAPLTYAWTRDGVAIAGANAAAYITPGTTAADAGVVYAVTVADAAGHTETASAVLTIDATPPYTVARGFITTDLDNDTAGAWSDAQVYVTVIGRDPVTGVFSWVSSSGVVTPMQVADNTAPGHLTSGGGTYPDYSFTLAQSHSLSLPPLVSGRIYVSLGSPVFLKVLAAADGTIGYAGPNPQNPTDPNIAVPFDWYEFTYENGSLDINTTQVDEFGLPLLLDVWGSGETFHQQVGINESLASLSAAFAADVPAAFSAGQTSKLRILAPAHAAMAAGGADANYLAPYIASIWQSYAATPLQLTLDNGSRRFSGTTTPTQFVFDELNASGAVIGGPYVVSGPPTTQDVLLCDNGFASGNPTELAIEAQLCAAFNRHVMGAPGSWTAPSGFYAAAPANFYAAFWHLHAVGGLAYGFAYDDVSDQSASIVSAAPEHMSLGIGW